MIFRIVNGQKKLVADLTGPHISKLKEKTIAPIISDLNTATTKLATIEEGAQVNISADWNAVAGKDGFIFNKPSLYVHDATHPASMITGLADVATSGDYEHLTNKPKAFTPEAHTHTIGNITNLEDDLTEIDRRMTSLENQGHFLFSVVTKAKLDSITLLDLPTWAVVNDFVTVQKDETRGNVATNYVLTNKSPIAWQFDVAFDVDITGKADANHTHVKANITNFAHTHTAIDGGQIDYDNLINKPDIPEYTPQLQSDWECTEKEDPCYIKNKPDGSIFDIENLKFAIGNITGLGSNSKASRIQQLVFLIFNSNITVNASNHLIGVIPMGYRPAQTITASVAWQGQSGNGTGNVTITSNGEIRYTGTASGGKDVLVAFSSIWPTPDEFPVGDAI